MVHPGRLPRKVTISLCGMIGNAERADETGIDSFKISATLSTSLPTVKLSILNVVNMMEIIYFRTNDFVARFTGN